ncbi:thermonuclease family protein [Pigmentiphaga humi]|nr:thermonuclease family protein [Pigmentiphaga humi]
MRILPILVLLAATVLPTLAQAQTCTVANVHDGDTMRLRCPGQQKTIPVRLERIDAPELRQAGGIASRDFLRALCPIGGPVTLTVYGRDRYRRTLGDVDCGKGSAQEAMLQSGNAWVYMLKFTADRRLMAIQRAAQIKKTGLWARPGPLPPWEWRRRHAIGG